MSRVSSISLLLGPAVLIAGAFAPGGGSTAKQVQTTDYKSEILPMLVKYCGACHGAKDNADMTLTALQAADSFKSQRDVWLRIEKNLTNKHMPPPGVPKPTDAEREKLAAYIGSALGPMTPNPGRVTMRRLNRQEYNNTIRDLFGIQLRPADDFPSDDVGYGFDNIGDVLSMSPLLMEKYLKAAESVAQTAIYAPGIRTWHIEGADIQAPNTLAIDDGSRELFTFGSVVAQFQLPVEGTYKVTVMAYQDKAGDADAKMAIDAPSGRLAVVDVKPTRGHLQKVECEFHAASGLAKIAASFLNDYYRAKTATTPAEDRNLFINSIDVTGPLDPVTKPPASNERIIFVHPTPTTRLDCERKILAAFAGRAYRRPPTEAEVAKLVAIAELAHKSGDSFERGIQLGVTAALCSPNFLFRVEKPASETLGSFEMASRLSYFLWSSMPDDELFRLAAKNQLQKPEVLDAQVRRMLSDPRASSLADDFAGQWLQTRKLAIVQPDRKLFPQFNEEVRRSMATETKMFFEDVVQNDRSVLEFLYGRFGFLDGPLAKLYGIPGVEGNEFKRVKLPPERAGVLTQGSVLVVTSNPTRTSPVKRGKWILENILGTPPPPPPPGVGVLKDDHKAVEASTLKQRMEQHRKDPMCAACHKQMDGLGFALENFDAVGAWRLKDGNFDVDASGTLPDGSEFTGPQELRSVLVKRKEQFVRCLAEKLLTYALGRGLESYDDSAVDKIVKKVSEGEYRFSTLVTAIVESEPFRKNRTEK